MPLITDVQVKRNVAIITLGPPSVVEGDDGNTEPSVRLPVDTVVLHHVRAGSTFDECAWEGIVTEGQRLLAVRHALSALSRRQYTERDLRDLLSRHFPADAVSDATERMRGLGYLDDAAWAQRYVASSRSAGRGRALLRQELRQHVADENAATAIETHDDEAAALVAARRRAQALRDVDEPKRTRRLYDFLRRRGFSDATTRRAMSAVDAESRAEDGVEGDVFDLD